MLIIAIQDIYIYGFLPSFSKLMLGFILKKKFILMTHVFLPYTTYNNKLSKLYVLIDHCTRWSWIIVKCLWDVCDKGSTYMHHFTLLYSFADECFICCFFLQRESSLDQFSTCKHFAEGWFICAIFTILFPIASQGPWNTSTICTRELVSWTTHPWRKMKIK